MFSGIVEAIGNVDAVDASDDGATLTVCAPTLLTGDGALAVSESISVSGACLTATDVDIEHRRFRVDVTPETLRRTTLGSLAAGARVNLERALRYGDRVGGHLVQGHVDGVGTVESVQPDGTATLVRVAASADIIAYTVEKGFVALDGVSLTCFNCDESGFSFSLIPFTAQQTTLGDAQAGAQLNVETDMTAKYVERLTPSPANLPAQG